MVHAAATAAVVVALAAAGAAVGAAAGADVGAAAAVAAAGVDCGSRGAGARDAPAGFGTGFCWFSHGRAGSCVKFDIGCCGELRFALAHADARD